MNRIIVRDAIRVLFLLLILLFANYESTTAQQPMDCFISPKIIKADSFSPCRIAKIDRPLASDQVREALYPLFWIKRHEIKAVGINICSEEGLLSSIPRSVVSPFDVLGQLRFIYGAETPRLLIKSGGCDEFVEGDLYGLGIFVFLSDPSKTEWKDTLDIHDINLQNLNGDIAQCRITPYSKALNNARKYLENNQRSVLGIYGYFIKSPTQLLNARLIKAKSFLRRSGVAESRIIVVTKQLNADTSIPCSESRLSQPFLEFLEMTTTK